LTERKAGAVHSLKISNDNLLCFTATEGGYINIWDVRNTLSILKTFDIRRILQEAGFNYVQPLATSLQCIELYNKDPNWIAFQLYNNAVGLLDMDSKRLVSLFTPPVKENDWKVSRSRIAFDNSSHICCGATGTNEAFIIDPFSITKIPGPVAIDQENKENLPLLTAGVQSIISTIEPQIISNYDRSTICNKISLPATIASITTHPTNDYIICGMTNNNVSIIGVS